MRPNGRQSADDACAAAGAGARHEFRSNLYQEIVKAKENTAFVGSTAKYQFKNTEQTHFLQRANQMQNILPGRELNPGLACDRRGYSPLYYRGPGFEALGIRYQAAAVAAAAVTAACINTARAHLVRCWE
ncbi:unnamed protein product [Heligmosomoides polygyrus]|uniref:Uncharacterized protein n=1 Tax=Heligmosomoides polygyrus TaxID=6339 RepID=A0A183GVD5_HELPZ|nr:unnamed protein product [Heligmosomoides polygyrus]